MLKILAIALEIVKESLRKHYLYIVLIIGIFFMLLSGCLYSSSMTINQKMLDTDKVVEIARVVSFHLVTFWGVLLAILFGAQVYKQELRNGHLQMILSKPIPRWYYSIGRLLGTYVILLISIASLGLLTNIIQTFRLHTFDIVIWSGFGVITLEILLALLFVSTLSLIIPRIIAIILSLISYLVSFIMNISVVSEAITHPSVPTKMKVGWKIVHTLTPPLTAIQLLASKVISGEALVLYDYQAILHAGVYSLVLIAIGIIIFNRVGR